MNSAKKYFLYPCLAIVLLNNFLLAQETSTTKDVYTGPFLKTEIPAGRNIPLNFPESAVLWDNGPLVTHPGGGAGGADVSVLQTALGMGTYGFGMQFTQGNSVADDFTISGSTWNIEEFHFFGYQTGSTNTSTFTDVYVQIYDGDPSAGGTVIWGDLATNVMTSSTWTNIYRTLDTDLTASTRPIMDIAVILYQPLHLSSGTYWIEWQTAGTLASGPWQPPVTILGSTGAGNAIQHTSTGWAALIDVSPQDLPFVILGYQGPPCPIDPPTNPDPPDGATGIDINLASLSWTIGAGANDVEVWFDGTMIYDGPAISAIAIPVYLSYSTTYEWRIVGKNDTCLVGGPIWSFTTMNDPNYLFYDNFSSGTSNWIVTNDGGTCVWEAWDIGTNGYLLPGSAGGNVMAADADYCGSGTTTLTTITHSGIDASQVYTVWLEFDNDWNAIDFEDFAMVDVSTDGGYTWQNVLTFDGNDVRNSHEIWDLTPFVSYHTFDIRFVSVQPGWDWWWAVDNIVINSYYSPYFPPTPPSNLVAIANAPGQVALNWQDNSNDEFGFNIQRKLGDSLSANQYQWIGLTEQNNTTYIDTTVFDTTWYTYRVSAYNDFGGWYTFSNQAEVLTIIPVELTFFEGMVYKENVKLKWSTATETNNMGFNIERRQTSNEKGNVVWGEIGFVEGHGTTTESHTYTFIDKETLSGTYQYRLKQIDYDGSYSYSNIIEVEVGIPDKFSLEQNYPNPFNPTTKIKYTLPSPYQGEGPGVRSMMTTLKVYDVLGNEVATLVNAEQPSGRYVVEFNSTGLSSGIYFYQIRAGEYSSTKKMMILK